MNPLKKITAIMLGLCLLSCQNNQTNTTENKAESAITAPVSDSFRLEVDRTPDTTKVSDNEVIRPVIITENDGLKSHLEYLHEEWNKVPNPLIVKYEGSDIGDYFHFMFEDKNGKTYDFGDGNNELGKMTFYDDEQNDNPKFVGKIFKITWEWKLSNFMCCEGEMDVVEAKVPSIVKISLVEN